MGRRAERGRSAAALLTATVVVGLVATAAWFAGLDRESGPLGVAAADASESAAPVVDGALVRDAEADADEPSTRVALRGVEVASHGDDGTSDADARSAAGDALAIGELEVHVRVGDRPAPAGLVVVRRAFTNDLAAELEGRHSMDAGGAAWGVIPDRGREERELTDGVARFGDLERGTYLVLARVADGPFHRALWVNSRARGGRVDFEVGDARVHGWVRDADGAAVQSAQLVIDGPQGAVLVDVGEDGSYDTGAALAPGRYTVELRGCALARCVPERRVDLAVGAVREVSFGAGSDLVHLASRVFAPDGEPLTPHDLVCGLRLFVVGHGPGRPAAVVDGAIDLWFEPGRYAVHLGHPGFRPPSRDEPFATLDLPRDAASDLRLPGFVLTGRVDAPPGESRAAVELQGPCAPYSFTEVPLRPDGSFRFVGLTAGAHALTEPSGRRRTIEIDPFGPVVVDLGALDGETGDGAGVDPSGASPPR